MAMDRHYRSPPIPRRRALRVGTAAVVLQSAAGRQPALRVRKPSRSAIQRWEAVADAAGRYAFSDLQPGRYLLAASSDGVVAEERLIEARAGTPVDADVEMKVAVVRQSVNVTATDASIETS